MTAKHLVDGLMQATNTRNHNQCTAALGLGQSRLCRMYRGEQSDFNVSTLIQMQEKTGLPFDTLLAWYRMGESETLGRITRKAKP